jgi:hypothetical protein
MTVDSKRSSMKIPVLFVSHPEKECGVHQFGKQVFQALTLSDKFDVKYAEVKDIMDLTTAINISKPEIMIVNWYTSTFPFISTQQFRSFGIPVACIYHEITNDLAGRLNDSLFEYYIAHDPSLQTTNGRVFVVGRPLLPFKNKHDKPAITTIGSLGFATPSKNFEGLVNYCHNHFDECIIRLNLPRSRFADPDGMQAKGVARRCQSIITKKNVKLEITHDFMSIEDTIDFLAKNSANAFFYNDSTNRGPSSAVDLAIAAGRPIILKKADMFRHLFNVKPSMFLEDRSMKEILSDGEIAVKNLQQEWSLSSLCKQYDDILQKIIK